MPRNVSSRSTFDALLIALASLHGIPTNYEASESAESEPTSRRVPEGGDRETLVSAIK